MKQENFLATSEKLVLVYDKLKEILQGLKINKTDVVADTEELIKIIQSIDIDVNEVDTDY